MAYSTKTDILDRMTEEELIQLTDDKKLELVDDGKVTAAIVSADATINSYAGGRYKLPLVATPKVTSLSADLAIYELEKRRRAIREATETAWKAAIAFLKDLSKGVASLNDQPSTSPQSGQPKVERPDRAADPLTFGDEHLKGL